MGLLKMMRWSYYLEKFRLLIKRNWNSRNLCNLQKWRVCLINLINHLMSKRFVLMIWWGKISQPARSGSFEIRVDKRCVTIDSCNSWSKRPNQVVGWWFHLWLSDGVFHELKEHKVRRLADISECFLCKTEKLIQLCRLNIH